jgi:hypothetical protein
MRTILIAVISVAIIAILIADGLTMYAAHRIAVEVAQSGAQQAAQVYVATGGDQGAAQDAVRGIANEAGVQLMSVSYHVATDKWYEVKVRVMPNSHFLIHVPYVRDLLFQESVAVFHF